MTTWALKCKQTNISVFGMDNAIDFDPLAVEDEEEIGEIQYDADENKGKNAEWIHEDLAQVRIKVFHGHQDLVNSCSFCANDQKAITSSYDTTVKLWDLLEGSIINTYEGHDLNVSQARPDPPGDRFVSCGWDKKVQLWNTETGRILWTHHHDGIVSCCDFSHDGQYVISGSDLDHSLKLWDAHNGQLIHEIKDLHKSTITSCKFSPNDERIITCSMDKTTKFWDVKSQCNTISVEGHINVISDTSLSQDEHKLATVSWDKSIALWDIATGAYRSKGADKIEKAHDGCISSCDFSQDGLLLVTGGFDHQVCVWDIENNCQRLRLQGHDDWVQDVCYSKDQKWILSASKDKTMRLWNIENTDDIPLVLEKKKAIGLRIFNCSSCGKQFSVTQADTADDVKLCVFCRLKSPDRML